MLSLLGDPAYINCHEFCEKGRKFRKLMAFFHYYTHGQVAIGTVEVCRNTSPLNRYLSIVKSVVFYDVSLVLHNVQTAMSDIQ